MMQNRIRTEDEYDGHFGMLEVYVCPVVHREFSGRWRDGVSASRCVLRPTLLAFFECLGIITLLWKQTAAS